MQSPRFDAVIVAGGAGRRMGGTDKAELEVGGARLIDRVVGAAAAAAADRIICVGPPRPTRVPVSWTREEPAGGGPAAAVAAGLELVTAPLVVVLAVDLPFVDRVLVANLARATSELVAAVATDERGRVQPLLACYPTVPLRQLTERTDTRGTPMMGLIHDMPYVTVHAGAQARDCDTWADLEEIAVSSGGGGHG